MSSKTKLWWRNSLDYFCSDLFQWFAACCGEWREFFLEFFEEIFLVICVANLKLNETCSSCYCRLDYLPLWDCPRGTYSYHLEHHLIISHHLCVHWGFRLCWGQGSFSTVALNFESEVHVLPDVRPVWSQHTVSYPQLSTTYGIH